MSSRVGHRLTLAVGVVVATVLFTVMGSGDIPVVALTFLLVLFCGGMVVLTLFAARRTRALLARLRWNPFPTQDEADAAALRDATAWIEKRAPR
jgi:hypothetical protein